MSLDELSLLRRVTGVVRLGHVRRIEPGRIVLERGTVPTGPGALYVHCASSGLNPRSRLNALSGLSSYGGEPRVQQAMARFVSNVGKATANLRA
jgi:hypothetical protein